MLAIVTRYPQRRHLAQNPFVCDCNLKWLADFLRANPIETSGARCASPRRLANKRIGQIKSKKFRCSGEHHPCHLQGLWPNLCCAHSGADVLFLSAAKEQYFIPGKGNHVCETVCVHMVPAAVPRTDVPMDNVLLWPLFCAHRGLWARTWDQLGCGRTQPVAAPILCSLWHTGTEDYQLNSECNSDVVCPPKCRCEAGVVECSNLKLTKIPERIPQSTAEL